MVNPFRVKVLKGHEERGVALLGIVRVARAAKDAAGVVTKVAEGDEDGVLDVAQNRGGPRDVLGRHSA